MNKLLLGILTFLLMCTSAYAEIGVRNTGRQRNSEIVYELTFYRTARDRNNAPFEVEASKKLITLGELNAEKQSIQAQIDAINA